jgi:surfactin family lipopeptide synthetase A
MNSYATRFSNLSPDKQALLTIRLKHHLSRDARATNASGSKRLIAYVVPDKRQPLTTDDLRGYLHQQLPDYMVPSHFITLDNLPLTHNGKVDRGALPAPTGARPELRESFVGPRSPVEQKLADIYCEVLRLDRVGIHDNFFDLGGHSLLATQVISRIQAAFEVRLPLRTMFEAPTVSHLSVAIVEAQAGQVDGQQIAELLKQLGE